MNYRPELDGLRAVAVLGVILFHLGVSGLSGGFVGVDVFFTLSGYLITGLILSGLETGTFAMGKFYVRRVRRLFPAALTVTALTGYAALHVVPETAIESLGKSVSASALSFSNFFFWSESGYFDESTDFKPLLHMWSLGVEEQFYVVWPTVLLLLFRWEKRSGRPMVLSSTIAILGGSLVWTVFSMHHESESAFYLPHLRAWEFALGACLFAYETRLPGKDRRRFGGAHFAAFIVGLCLVVLPCFLYSPETPFPGLTALIPCGGTLLVIASGAPGSVGRILTNPVATFVGKISYSLYLVHWPIICLYRFRSLRDFSAPEQAGLFAATCAAAMMLYFLVETPLRRPATRSLPGGWFVAVSLVLACSIFVLGWQAAERGGMDQQISRSSQQILDYLKKTNDAAFQVTMRDVCYITKKGRVDEERCLKPQAALPNILLVGDSHAANWYPGMVRHYEGTAHVNLSAVMSCRPLLFPTSKYPACRERNDRLFDKMDLSVYDGVYVVGGFYKRKEWEGLPAALKRLEQRGARRLVVLGAPMSYEPSVPVILSKYSGESADVALAKLNGLILPRFFTADEPVRQAARRAGMPYLSLVRLLCPSGERGSCLHAIPGEGMPFVRDSRHLSPEGVEWILDQWKATGHTL